MDAILTHPRVQLLLDISLFSFLAINRQNTLNFTISEHLQIHFGSVPLELFLLFRVTPCSPSHIQILRYTQGPPKSLLESKFFSRLYDCLKYYGIGARRQTYFWGSIWLLSSCLLGTESSPYAPPETIYIILEVFHPVTLLSLLISILSYLNKTHVIGIIWDRIIFYPQSRICISAACLCTSEHAPHFHWPHTCRDAGTVRQHGLHRRVQWLRAGDPVATVLSWNRYNVDYIGLKGKPHFQVKEINLSYKANH